MVWLRGFALIALIVCQATCSPSWVSVDGETYINKGLVAFGRIPANFTDSTGDTLGGIGSAVAIKARSFFKIDDGKFTGTLIVQPDRGYNVEKTVDYQARHHSIDFTLTPYYGSEDLSFTTAQQTLQLTYRNTLLYYDRKGRTTGLDALAVRPAVNAEHYADPPLPIPSQDYSHLSIDAEGFAQGASGTFWVSEEYGPYIYQFTSYGQLIQVIQPPQAILPYQNDKLNFTGSVDPDTGRSGNQGLEGLTVSSCGTTLYALLQSAVMQDGGGDKDTNRYTRMIAYDISQRSPVLTGEWVVPLPQRKGKTLAASELHFVTDNIFLVLSRDGDGAGGGDNKSSYKQIDLIDISTATDIHGTKYDKSSKPVAKDGILKKSVTPAVYLSFVSLIDSEQLARFGLHNGKPGDETLIASKWESIALASIQDPNFPDDYFLFTVADNDFVTTNGISVGQPYDAGLNIDNQFLVFRVTLPGAEVPE